MGKLAIRPSFIHQTRSCCYNRNTTSSQSTHHRLRGKPLTLLPPGLAGAASFVATPKLNPPSGPGVGLLNREASPAGAPKLNAAAGCGWAAVCPKENEGATGADDCC